MRTRVFTQQAISLLFIGAAAVADYRPATRADHKIKKDQSSLQIELERTRDIVSEVAMSYPDLYVVGFAAETRDVEHYARDKLQRKKLRAIVANDVSRSDIGFNSDNNEALWITHNASHNFGKRSKNQLARDIVSAIATDTGH